MKRVEDYTEEDHKAIREFEMASINLRKAVGGKVGEQSEKDMDKHMLYAIN